MDVTALKKQAEVWPIGTVVDFFQATQKDTQQGCPTRVMIQCVMVVFVGLQTHLINITYVI